MRIFFVLAMFAASFLISISARANSWLYDEAVDDSGEVMGVGAFFVSPEGGVNIGCSSFIGIAMGARFYDAAPELDPDLESEAGTDDSPPSITVTWRVDNGEAMEAVSTIFDGTGYSVLGPKALELARMLVEARQFETSNGGEGPSMRILQFDNLDGGEQIERVLSACGH